MDVPPPPKKPRSALPALSAGFDSNIDFSWNPLEINSELPEELVNLGCQSTTTNNKKAEDTIQKNQNLSQLLSSNNDLLRSAPMNPMGMQRAPVMHQHQQHFRHQMLPQQQQQQQYAVSMQRPGFGAGFTGGGGGGIGSSNANNMYMYNQMPSTYPPRHLDYMNNRMMSSSNAGPFFANNCRSMALNGTVYPSAGGVLMPPSDPNFCGNQFPVRPDSMYSNQMPVVNKMAMQMMNGSASAQHHPCGDVVRGHLPSSSSASGSVVPNCPHTPYSSAELKVATSKPLTSMASNIMSPDSNVFPVSPAVSSSENSDNNSSAATTLSVEKRREIQNQLILILHAHKCTRRDQTNGSTQAPCSVVQCSNMKKTLKHMTECEDGKSCKVTHCSFFRQIITHYKNCTRTDCPVCSPLKNKRNNTQPVAVNALNSCTSQPSTNSGVPDRADMMQTYKTLGLDPRDQMNPNFSSPAGTGLAPTSSSSSSAPLVTSNNHKVVTGNTLTSSPEQPTNAPCVTPGEGGFFDGAITPDRSWHATVNQNLRDHLVQKLVQAIFPSPPDLAVVKAEQMSNLIKYAKKVEGDMYDCANSREEYYHMLAEKIYKIQKELEEKRLRRLQLDNPGTAVTGGTLSGLSPHGPGSMNRLPQFFDSRFDPFMTENNGLNRGPVLPPPAFQNRFQLQDIYSMRSSMRIQGPSSSSGCTDVHSVTGKPPGQVYRPMLADGINIGQRPDGFNIGQRSDGFNQGQKPNSTSAKQDLQFVQHDQTDSNNEDSVPAASAPISGVMVPSQGTQPRQPLQQRTSSNQLHSTQAQGKQSPSFPRAASSGHSPSITPTLPSRSNAASPAAPMNGEHTPPLASASCNTQSSSPTTTTTTTTTTTGNFKMTIKHEDISEDEVTVKSEPRSGKSHEEFFKYDPSPMMHENITDDEAETIKTEEERAIEIKAEVKEECVDTTATVATETVDDGDAVGNCGCESSAVKQEADEKPQSQSSVKTESIEREEMKTEETEAAVEEKEDPPPQLGRKVWKPEELFQVLLPTLEKLFTLDEAGPFLLPVDHVFLAIPDYHDIIKRPMDLSTIREKLETGQYADPWEYIDDVNLMFDNAWLYNRKASKVYKCCSKLAEVFEANIDGVMQSLGFCCGRRYVFSPQVLCCFGKQLCTIPRDTIYYNYQDRYIYCEKCFNDLQGDDIEMMDDPSQPGIKIKKEQFVREKNSKLDYEQFVECKDCCRKMHKICVLQMEQIWSDGFVCDNCLKLKNGKRKENRYTAKRLPATKLSTYLETRVNSLLKRKDAGAGEVTIRVLSSYDKAVEVKPGMKTRYVNTGQMPDRYPYRVKAMFAFEEIDGIDVCFFGMHVQEYGSDCHKTNARRVYIAYLDSVHYFQPRIFRTTVYHEILIGYLDYVKSLGFQMAHIWACPPSEGDDYIFHCHPIDQKIPKPRRLQEWYKKMLDKALTDRVIFDYKDILKDALEAGFQSVTDMPYFEGDFWPNILEECIKELDQEEMKRQQEEQEALMSDTMIDYEPTVGDSVEMQTFAGKKKGQKSGKSKKKNTKSKKPVNRKSKSGLHSGNDLSDKLLSTMEKHKEGFFVIRLQNSNELVEIKDPDPLINCDLMDGRDAFLTLARDKHYEFTSLRRAKYSSMGLLYELHNQAKDSFVYSCNDCKANVETRYHCKFCDDYDLCVTCYHKSEHEHKSSMIKLGLDLDENVATEIKAQNPDEARRISAQAYIQSLEHASQCRDANCRSKPCPRMKQFVTHMKNCRRADRKSCQTCKRLLPLCYAHAKLCKENKCLVPLCPNMKQKLEQKRAEQQFKQQQLMRRRMALMQRAPEMESMMSQTMSDPPTPTFSGSNCGGGNGGGKFIHGMAPSPPSGAIFAARQAEQTAQRQAGAGMGMGMGGYMPGMPMQHQHQRQAMGIPPNHHMMDPGMYMGKPMSMQDEMMFHSHGIMGTHGMRGPSGSHPMDVMSMQQQQQQQSGPTTSKQMAMVLAKLKAQPSQQPPSEVLSMLKQNPQLMASFIKQSHNQQNPMTGGHSMSSGMNPSGHMMDGMIDDPGGPMCNLPPGMMPVGQGHMSADPMRPGQPRMSSQWLQHQQQQHQHQMRSMHPDYGQQFPHMMSQGVGMYGGGRMRMSFGPGGHPQPYPGDEMMQYSAMSHSQQQQMQMMMMQRRIQARQRMELGPGGGAGGPGPVGGCGGGGQTMMPGMSGPRGNSIGLGPVDNIPPQLPSLPCSMPSNSALTIQPGVRTHLNKIAPSPRRPPPHYAETVLMHAPLGGGGLQRMNSVPTAMPIASDLNPYAMTPNQSQLRFSVGRPGSVNTDFSNNSGGVGLPMESLQYSNKTPHETLSRFVGDMPQ